MVGSVIENRLHAHYRISGQRSLRHGFLNTLFHCREIVLRNRAAYNYLLEYIRRLQITGGLEGHLYVTVLAVSAGLFLILGIHICFLLNGLPESNLRLGKFYRYLELLLQLAHNHIQMLIAHTIEQSLTVFRIIDAL